MKFETYKTEFETKASKLGYSSENIQKCLNYAKPLLEKKLPIIYNTSHLSVLVGYRKDYLKRAAIYTPYFYRDFEIKKRNGKMRTISEPLPSLKDIQNWILVNILEQIKISPFAKAYRKNIGLIDNVRFHQNQPMVMTLDLKEFFPSISIEKVEILFLEMGYSKLISNLLSKLCTKDGFLPQGAPTSPYLSNIYFKPADNLIIDYCLKNNIRYTRYADDLSFSGDFDPEQLKQIVENAISSIKLFLNNKKTKLMKPHERQVVTGIVVNNKPQVVFHKRNKLRQEIYFIQKFGIENHMSFKKINNCNYLEHLLGKVNFILHLNPNDKEFSVYKEYLVNLKRNSNESNSATNTQ